MSEGLAWGGIALRLLPAGLGLALAAGWATWWIAGVWLLALSPLMQPIAVGEGGWALSAALELSVGIALAFSLCAPLWAARQGGALLELGWGGRWGPAGALSSLFGGLALALFASLGGLRLWSRTLVEASALRLDAAAASLLDVGMAAAALVGELVRLALSVAAPAWIAFVLTDLAMALVSRLSGAPGRAIVGLSLPLRLSSVALALPVGAESWPEWWRLSAEATSRLVQGWTS